ncbi:hypothetical protein AYL99_02789 [Fonsecaea erecta]|uniref:Uncharacterized protein n=1 Tax=Fonsecaea erecta TaxID=1367422 RepID=A0A178ZV47_9EURO|nr:hypothetical protein AYL99_02789 [Fonsecaea erecta]OAP63562.1 hypothetical protein AYL99_02789 [Fonsecaea erecta]
MSTTVRVKLYNSVTADQHLTTADVPIDGKPHNVRDLFKPNNPAYPGKVTGNTVSIGDFKGATFTLLSPSGTKVLVRKPEQTGMSQQFSGDQKPLGNFDAQDYDLSDFTITLNKGS